MTSYAAKMAIAIIILLFLGYIAIKYLPSRLRVSADGRLKLLGAMSLGRDAIYVVRTGPSVVALLVSRNGSSVIGTWSAEEWDPEEEADQ